MSELTDEQLDLVIGGASEASFAQWKVNEVNNYLSGNIEDAFINNTLLDDRRKYRAGLQCDKASSKQE